MRIVQNQDFIKSLKVGDIGLIKADNFFSTAQDWFRIKCEDAPSQFRASHAFIMKETPLISEANGLKISESSIIKDVGDTTLCWLYRYPGVTGFDGQAILDYCASQEGKTFYSILGIAQFGLQYVSSFFGKKNNFADQPGKFCSEYCLDMAKAQGWPTPPDAYLITPSGLRYWMETEGIKAGWYCSGVWDGTNYWVA